MNITEKADKYAQENYDQDSEHSIAKRAFEAGAKAA